MSEGSPGAKPAFSFDPDHYRLLEQEMARGKIMRHLPWLATIRWFHIVGAAIVVAAAAIAWLYFDRTAEPPAAAVAVVDGVPIMPADLAVEAQSNGLDPQALDKAGRAAMLQRVIDRRILVNAARESGLANNPRLKASVTRAGEMLTAGAMAQRLLGTPASVDDAAAQRYAAANPYAFAQRQLLTLDVVEADNAALRSASLDKLETVDEVVAKLRGLGVAFERNQRQVDSATLPSDLAAAMIKATPETLFRLPLAGRLAITSVTAREPAPRDAAQTLAVGRVAAEAAQRDAQLRRALHSLRAKTKIQIVS